MKIVDHILGLIETSVIVITSIGMIVCITLQIMVRYLQLDSLYWTEELARYCMIYCVFFGVSSGFKTGAHIGVDALLLALPQRISKWVTLLSKVIVLALCILLTKAAVDYVAVSRASVSLSPTLKLPMYYIYYTVCIGFGLSAIRVFMTVIDFWQTEILQKPKGV